MQFIPEEARGFFHVMTAPLPMPELEEEEICGYFFAPNVWDLGESEIEIGALSNTKET